MGAISWAPLLHFYQPPTQIPMVLRKIVNESYRPLIEVFRHYPHAKATVNINGVLTEMLFDHGYTDVIEGLKGLAERGQFEFVGSGKYHPILPLIPETEMRRQIDQNFQANRQLLGDGYRPRGFFSPEMCYGANVVRPIVDSSHEWIILSGIACPVDWPVDRILRIAGGDSSPAVFFRDDILSNKISFRNITGHEFVNYLRELQAGHDRDRYVVTAMDAETFGHHIKNWERLFLAVSFEEIAPHSGSVQIVTISDLLHRFPKGPAVEPHASSWSTTADDLKAGNPYPLWKDPGNYIHKLLWQHIDLLLQLLAMAEESADSPESKRYADTARALMDPALHSDQMWWASRRPHWDVNMIDRGVLEGREVVLNTFRAINLSSASEEAKREAHYQVVAARDIEDKIQDQLFW
jgi:predicted glycosyl hydrolase (DUF1957 family)